MPKRIAQRGLSFLDYVFLHGKAKAGNAGDWFETALILACR
jgi:hypothetical protein